MLFTMKNKTFLITFLSAAAFAVGCNKETTTAQQTRQWVSDKIAP
jgi:hypothetical protein